MSWWCGADGLPGRSHRAREATPTGLVQRCRTWSDLKIRGHRDPAEGVCSGLDRGDKPGMTVWPDRRVLSGRSRHLWTRWKVALMDQNPPLRDLIYSAPLQLERPATY